MTAQIGVGARPASTGLIAEIAPASTAATAVSADASQMWPSAAAAGAGEPSARAMCWTRSGTAPSSTREPATVVDRFASC